MKFLPFEDSSSAVINQTVNWYYQVKEAKVNRLRVVISPTEFEEHKDRMWGWYSGQVPCAIRADLPSRHVFWLPKWLGHDKSSPKDGRIWDVEYVPRNSIDFTSLEGYSSDEATSKLRDALGNINEFSTRHGMKSWSVVFAQALDLTSSSSVSIPEFPDLAPRCEDESHRLLAAGLRSWVFGGMGWWNDIGPFWNPITTRDYRTVTERLFSAVLTALVVGANSCTERLSKNNLGA